AERPSRGWCFFFSSRRRHTRWPRDWSSDVCSSDLLSTALSLKIAAFWLPTNVQPSTLRVPKLSMMPPASVLALAKVMDRSVSVRSEERRVGKECRSLGEAARLERKGESRARVLRVG